MWSCYLCFHNISLLSMLAGLFFVKIIILWISQPPQRRQQIIKADFLLFQPYPVSPMVAAQLIVKGAFLGSQARQVSRFRLGLSSPKRPMLPKSDWIWRLAAAYPRIGCSFIFGGVMGTAFHVLCFLLI